MLSNRLWTWFLAVCTLEALSSGWPCPLLDNAPLVGFARSEFEYATLCRNGCLAALGWLKKVAERGPWAGELQDALEWVCAILTSGSNLVSNVCMRLPCMPSLHGVLPRHTPLGEVYDAIATAQMDGGRFFAPCKPR